MNIYAIIAHMYTSHEALASSGPFTMNGFVLVLFEVSLPSWLVFPLGSLPIFYYWSQDLAIHIISICPSDNVIWRSLILPIFSLSIRRDLCLFLLGNSSIHLLENLENKTLALCFNIYVKYVSYVNNFIISKICKHVPRVPRCPSRRGARSLITSLSFAEIFDDKVGTMTAALW